jgi:hypothetical protein
VCTERGYACICYESIAVKGCVGEMDMVVARRGDAPWTSEGFRARVMDVVGTRWGKLIIGGVKKLVILFANSPTRN